MFFIFIFLFANKLPGPIKHLSEQAPTKSFFLSKHPEHLISHLQYSRTDADF